MGKASSIATWVFAFPGTDITTVPDPNDTQNLPKGNFDKKILTVGGNMGE
jgi:hypothetical protein